MLNFEEVEKTKLTDVLGRYGIRLRFKGEWASAPCPLPTHKAGDKGRNFTINLGQNYWRCFSESCNQNNEGRKGGDIINFVALMENCRERDAAQISGVQETLVLVDVIRRGNAPMKTLKLIIAFPFLIIIATVCLVWRPREKH